MVRKILSVCASIPQTREQLFRFSGSQPEGPGFNFIWSLLIMFTYFLYVKIILFLNIKKFFFKLKGEPYSLKWLIVNQLGPFLAD